MASNDQWPPVAPVGKNSAKNRSSGNVKRPTKEDQQQVLSGLTEMFQKTLESEVILSVAHNCDWELQSCIDALIALSSTVESPDKQTRGAFVLVSRDSGEQTEPYAQDLEPDFFKMDKIELQKQKDEFKKFEKIKKTTSKNRMGSFRGNISKLDSKYQEKHNPGSFDSIWNPPKPQSKADEKNWNDNSDSGNNAQFVLPQMPLKANPWIEGLKQVSTNPLSLNTHNPSVFSEKNSISSQNKPKKESEFCGLKVQYRIAGMESSSEDDDADVVIEQELNCSIPTSLPVNVSQLLSSSIQSPPQVACSYKAKTITTPSPPRTPKRSIHEATLDRIKRAILNRQKIMVLMRGLPGSGKSSLAKSLVSTLAGNPSDYIFSSDDYFVTLGCGIYMYDPRRIEDAHTTNQKKVNEALKREKTPVIVDNTNTQAWEMRPYAAMAVKFGYIVVTLEPDTSWATNVSQLAKKNSHGVPKEKIEQMLLRFEPGITGEKLLVMFSLRYPPGSDPRELNITEDCKNDTEQVSGPTLIVADRLLELEESADKKDEGVGNITLAEVTELDEFKPNPGEEYILQVLGAIGSERKNSVVATDLPSMPDLSNEEINSPNHDILSHCSEMQEQDEEFGKKGKRNGESPVDQMEDDGVRSAVHNFLSELTQGYNSTSGGFVPEQRQSTVIITELFEEQEIQNVEDIAVSLLESTDIGDGEKHGDIKQEGQPEVIQKKSEDEELPILENEAPIEDEKIENSSGEDRDMSIIDAENLSDIETTEEPGEPQTQSTLGNFFNMINVLILGNTQDEEAQGIDTEIEEGKELKEYSLLEEPQLESKIVPNSAPESIFRDHVNINSSIAEIKAAIDSTDSDVLTQKINSSDNQEGREFYSLESESLVSVKMSSLEETNVFSSELEKVECIPNEEMETKPESSAEPEILDNINRITWKESPFPVDDLLLPKMSTLDKASCNVPKHDASTNTSYYDFNVSYIGGTSEPMYRVIPAFNRYINESIPHIQPERPPVKLMLDKSSMTGNIFSREGNPEVEGAEEKKDRFFELMELFPDIPRDYLAEIYEKVNEDLDWAVELLLEGVTENVIIKPEENSGLQESSTEQGNITSSEIVQFTVLDSSPPQSPGSTVQSKDENQVEDEDKQQEENEEKYLEELGVIEGVKDSAADVSDDAASTSTTSVSRLESIEDEKSSESDELLDLNLGFDCIKGLEKALGIPNFHIPESFSPVIQIKKSVAEELYASWIESLSQQANTRHEQLDQMMAEDAELARSLERRMELEGAITSDNSVEPNLEQIMDMELALAKYKNELKSIISRETPDDLAARLSRQMLHEAIPDIDPDALNEILQFYHGNFKEAFEVIQMETGRAIVPCDTLKKQKILMDKVKEEDRNLGEREPPIIVVRTRAKDERLGYNTALAHARDSREEAQRQLSLKIQNYNKAAEAYRKGCPGVAAYYSQVARLHTKNIDAAHAAAASAFVEAQSWDDEETLDLHNLFVSEALTALDEFLEYHMEKLMRSNKRSSKIYIITGRGARSNNGTSKIKPAVSQKLISKNIKFSEANPGCLKVTLYKKKWSN
ncbi:NEDD4-binding protein 2 [Fopius arisanus]|uniref:NEDD4-binding protein 2 n=1 Tax=Fopius arisanus TaxID=64838 RepID=A0A9R1TVV5_9HYME|nr:PREDICTED: NEDD4-binding protein 2 [Fopius arisanus]XP_011298395.1 PREDICTED: NEDD4-binding protein 2 [Fopius arisanus]